jgi:hypothetical protein
VIAMSLTLLLPEVHGLRHRRWIPRTFETLSGEFSAAVSKYCARSSAKVNRDAAS